MKQLWLILIFLTCVVTVFAQKNDEPVVVDTEDYEGEQKINLPFSVIKVIDARFDRSNIGCVNKSISINSFKHHKSAAVFPDSLHLYLPRLLNQLVTLSTETHDTLVMLIKQFRISDHVVNSINLQHEPELLLKISASFFKMRKDQLVKLFSIDDLLSKKWPTDKKLNKERLVEFRLDALMALLQNVFQNKPWQINGDRFSVAMVQEGIDKRFHLPVLTDTILKPGIYKNFHEFKQNRPSLINVKMGIRHSCFILGR